MNIDAHNHLGGPDKGDGKSQSPSEIIRDMDEADIDKAVVFPFNNPDDGFRSANNFIADAVLEYPDRLIGFMRLDPKGRDPLGELRRAFDLGLCGIKLHPAAQQFDLKDPVLDKIVLEAERFNLPLIFDSGKRLSPPSGFSRLAKLSYGVIILAHMRGDGYLDLLKEYPNTFIQTTKGTPEAVLEAVEVIGADRIISGSDSPYIAMMDEKRKIENLPISAHDKRLILGANMERILR